MVKSATALRQLTSVHIHNSIAIEQYVVAGDCDGDHRPDDDLPSLLDICLLHASLQGLYKHKVFLSSMVMMSRQQEGAFLVVSWIIHSFGPDTSFTNAQWLLCAQGRKMVSMKSMGPMTTPSQCLKTNACLPPMRPLGSITRMSLRHQSPMVSTKVALKSFLLLQCITFSFKLKFNNFNKDTKPSPCSCCFLMLPTM